MAAAGVPVLPYLAEYAKSGRAGCKTCKSNIEKGALRLAVMVQSPFFDGKMPMWHHGHCFMLKQKPKGVGDIAHFDSLRWDDQELLRKKYGTGDGVSNSTGGEGSSSNGNAKTKESLKDFKIEYAKSGGSTCIACDQKIGKSLIRIAKKDYESDSALMYGALDRWHHVDCFLKVREAIQFYEPGTKIPGYKDLDKEDKVMIKNKIPAITPGKRKNEDKVDTKPSKMAKTETVVKEDKSAKKTGQEAKDQNKKMFVFRDKLEANFKKKDYEALLTHNKQEIPSGLDTILDRLADIMTFGALLPCKVCKKGQLVYRSGRGYICVGDLTAYTKCGYNTTEPERTVFKVPKDYKDNFKEKFVVASRIIPVNIPTTSTSAPTFVKLDPKPLKNLKICFIGEIGKDELETLQAKIKLFGGVLRSNPGDNVSILIATKDDVPAGYADNKKIGYARCRGMPLVSKEFMNRIGETMVVLDEIKNTLLPICDWVKPKDVAYRLNQLHPELEKKETKIKEGKANRNNYELPTETKVKLRMKDGAVVDPESELESWGHVLKDGSTYYNSVLNKTDVDAGTNSYYKIQIIESDKKNSYKVFRSWGRIGTTIGGVLVSDSMSREEAIDLFNEKYTEKTQNVFGKKFVKYPEYYLPMEIDYGSEETLSKLVPSKTESNLHLAVQELICLIFDVENMKSALLEFEIDIQKMPLGKLSRKQILKAYAILNEALKFVKASTGEPINERLLADVSNRFYTLIPHNFGTSLPPPLNTDAVLKTKVEMLENMLEIELAYELLRDDGDAKGGSLVDKHYSKLNTELSVVEAKSKEYEVIQKYLSNTHASTHTSYKLDIEQIFKVNRSGESSRFEKFNKMGNRKLLWHGSRTTNYAGILSQGLRIAPPEAPVTGYMFGKGIYFADMVSKSANYCYTSASRTTGLLMLCEVALGEMYEVKSAKENLTKPPVKYDSVKGLGQTHPDPAEKTKFSNGVEVPHGKPVPSKVDRSELLYNEYIVYDPAQVKIRYLLKCNFKYGGSSRR